MLKQFRLINSLSEKKLAKFLNFSFGSNNYVVELQTFNYQNILFLSTYCCLSDVNLLSDSEVEVVLSAGAPRSIQPFERRSQFDMQPSTISSIRPNHNERSRCARAQWHTVS